MAKQYSYRMKGDGDVQILVQYAEGSKRVKTHSYLRDCDDESVAQAKVAELQGAEDARQNSASAAPAGA